ncbi:MAG: hypothetical protein A2808_02865 [Candidatus Moranbacteria bacterium RIFCSPHIGHO2_01_FULL_55_24]|nr:MAG: hypothetical protein A2808_02865 [Candidatus Moranbacteria bacterium RIFCSPHIGHO2_01_FULL_55_24]
MKKVDAKVSFPKLEEEVLKYWDEKKIFEKSLNKESSKGEFVFYEGPPTANGKPGLHHVLARSFKDIVPRFRTMQGYRVRRKAGWDTHGLPVELQVEKALGLRSKQDIENIVPGDARASVIEFNKKCKESVWEYKDPWEKMTERMGYWVDMKNPYITYDNSYIESVWWQLKQIAELKNSKDESFLYKGHKVVPYCYRCGTALSSHEVAQGYQTVKDNSVSVKFRVEPGQKIGGVAADDKTFLVAWTTTPWTLPGNVALAVNENIKYWKREILKGEHSGETYIVALDGAGDTFAQSGIVPVAEGVSEEPQSNLTTLDGKDLIGIKYEPLYRVANDEKSYQVVSGDFVTTDSGTGIVHIAPAFGEDDANVGKENGLPTLLTVEAEGTLVKGFDLPGEGIPVKKKNDKNHYAVDDLIIEDLKNRNLLFKEEVYEHEYPFCWRCDTPLIYYAKPSWFIRMSELQEELTKNNADIRWVPEHIKEGRFGEWLRGVKDWAISRERYWGTPLPIWNCEKCEKQVVVGSQAELKEFSGILLNDLHKPYIDDVAWQCSCGGTMKRTPEVLDVWFDSGAMPLAQAGYLGGESEFSFPADYISEAIDQTRGWFYTLHAIATLLHKAGKVPTGNAYRNVICLGHILDAKGKKMSKSKGNIIEPFQMFDEYGADALRWLFFSINQPGLPKRFDVKAMRDVQNRLFRMLWNSYSFFTTYAVLDGFEPKEGNEVTNTLDRWILSELQILIKEMTEGLENYDIYSSTQKIEKFVDNLSNWYIRRSRKRFWKNENDSDKEGAYQTLYTVLVELSKLMAPFTPFISEEIYRNLTGEESVHLADWPKADEKLIDAELSQDMDHARFIVTMGLKFRADGKMKVRQPLQSVTARKLDPELQEIVKEELNVKEYRVRDIGELVELDLTLTPELKLEGEAREIIRAIQDGRKKAGFNVEDRISLGYSGKEAVFGKFQDEIAKEVLATAVENKELSAAEYSETTDIEGESFSFSLKRA